MGNGGGRSLFVTLPWSCASAASRDPVTGTAGRGCSAWGQPRGGLSFAALTGTQTYVLVLLDTAHTQHPNYSPITT